MNLIWTALKQIQISVAIPTIIPRTFIFFNRKLFLVFFA